MLKLSKVLFSFALGQRRVSALQKQLAELKIEIDQSKRKHDVDVIVESEYFQSLKVKAAEMRSRAGGS